jgi:tetratricopeptide (TPR) repeat protein
MPEHSVQLAALAATLASQQVTHYEAASTDGEPDAARRLAGSLNNLAVRLGGVGRWEEALAASQEAAGIYRELAAARPDAFRPDLAGSLNNLSILLGGLGRQEEALATIQEAVTIRQELAAMWPDAHRQELEQSLRVVAWLEAARERDNGPGSNLPARNQLRRADHSGDAGLPPGVAVPGHRVSGRPGRSGLLRAPQKPHKPATR